MNATNMNAKLVGETANYEIYRDEPGHNFPFYVRGKRPERAYELGRCETFADAMRCAERYETAAEHELPLAMALPDELAANPLPAGWNEYDPSHPYSGNNRRACRPDGIAVIHAAGSWGIYRPEQSESYVVKYADGFATMADACAYADAHATAIHASPTTTTVAVANAIKNND